MDRYAAVAIDLEDFWNRRRATPRYSFDGYIFGHPFRLLANDPQLLDAASFSLPLFSQAPPLTLPPFQIRLVVNPEREESGPPPDSLFDRIWYTGAGDWLMIHLGPWGHAYVNMARRESIAVLSPSLAARPEVVSHSLLNTILLNLCLYHGYGMLHASCLVRADRALLLMAPHNAGKSTTALHLVLAGYRLLTDSMVHISPFSGQSDSGLSKKPDQGASIPRPLLCGFPVGKIKLRRDMLPLFPQLQPMLEREQVRDETKFSLDLRRLDPKVVLETAWSPAKIELCLLSRHEAAQTRVISATDEDVWDAALRNSLFYDQESVWQRNLAQITPLIEQSSKHHLVIGSDSSDIVRAIDELWLK